MADSVVRVEHVSKDFVLPHEKASTVKGLFTGIYKRHRSVETQHALRDINFDIQPGEFFGIVGRNGSGKSTMLKILAGIYQPTKGQVHTYGKIVPFIELGVGFNPELSGRDNVYLNCALFGFTKAQVDALYDDIVKFAELERFMDQKLKNYSSGMQVRLAFSLAIKAEADILLIDEVLAVGDADFQRKCFRYFKQLKRLKKTVIFVTHDMDAVREYCDRAVLINDHKVALIGSPDNVARQYLKIMTPSDSSSNGTEQTERWGDGSFNISDVQIDKLDAKEIVFSFIARANRDCEDPVYGFRIRNMEGIGIAGTNSLILGNKPQAVKKGDALKSVWRIDNIFAEGTYSIDPAVVYESNTIAADWWDGALEFTVNKDRHTPYLTDPATAMEMMQIV